MPVHLPFDDTDTPISRYALVYAPKHKRERVPEQCVFLMEDAAAALSGADAQQCLFAARGCCLQDVGRPRRRTLQKEPRIRHRLLSV